MTIKVDRSRILQYQTCPRRRYWEYHYQGKGIRANRVNIPLTVGSATHVGLELLLLINSTTIDKVREVIVEKRLTQYHKSLKVKGEQVDVNELGIILDYIDAVIVKSPVEIAVNQALYEYDTECKTRSFQQEDLDVSFVYNENRALIEALIRLYAKVQLPRLFERFEVLEVEKEIEVTLSEEFIKCGHCYGRGVVINPANQATDIVCRLCNGSKGLSEKQLILMSRPDAILRERSTGAIYVLSFKTSAGWMGELSESQNRWDVQGISELVATESWLSQAKLYTLPLVDNDNNYVKGFNPIEVAISEKVAGIKMEHLIKGSYSKALTDQPLMQISKGQKFYSNILIHPYANQSQFAFGASELDLRFEYEWVDGITGKTNRLGKDWKRCNLWELGDRAIADWIEFMAGSEEGLALLERMVVCPVEYYRNQEDVEEWIESTIYQESIIDHDVRALNCGSNTLAQVFPRYRHSCFSYNSPCQFIGICWEGMTPEQLLETGEMQFRSPNHTGEVFEV